jgi:Galactose oxidase, central domain
MRFHSRLPRASTFPSSSTKAAKLSKRLGPTVVVIIVAVFAATAGATGVSRSGSLRQLFSGKSPSGNLPTELPAKAFANTSLIPSALPQSGASLNSARRGHTATRLADGRVLIAGGENSTGHLSESEIFDPASGTFSVAEV